MKIEPTFQLRMHGQGKDGQEVRPGSVDVKDLIELLSNWEKAIIETADSNNVSLPSRENATILSLVEITDSSYGLGMKVLEKAVIVVGIISEALATGRFEGLPPKAVDALAAVSRQAEKNKWAVQIVPGTSSVIRAAEISADNPVPAYAEPFVHGTTTLIGQLLRVGGADPKAEIRDEFGELHFIKVDAETAKLLALRLYQDISVEGNAIWSTDTWKIDSFKATEVNDYHAIDPVSAFEELTRRVQGAWDGVDVEAYFKAERSESD